MATIHHRRAMTLVELLVVVAIVGLLAVTVLPNVASTTESRRTREATRVASTFIARAQSRAIGRPEWAGVSFLPTGPGLYCIDLFQANVPQIYRGETYGMRAYLETFNPTSRRLFFYDVDAKQKVAYPDRNVNDGDLIRFDGIGPWYEISNPAGLTPPVWYLTMRGSLDGSSTAIEPSTQTSRITPWPTQSNDPTTPWDTTHSFEILRQAVPNGTSFTTPDGRCIDLTWSGFGGVSTYRTFVGEDYNRNGVLDLGEDANGNGSIDLAPSPLPLTILFDAAGRLRQIQQGVSRLTITGPVYLLVGRVDRATNTPSLSNFDGKDDTRGFNWQYGDSFWICIDPMSGIVRTAECYPGQTDVVSSQRFIRAEMAAGGR